MNPPQSCNHIVPAGEIVYLSHQLEGQMEWFGGGGCADIYCVKLNAINPPRKIAIKCFRPVPSQEDASENMKSELKIWKLLSHNDNPNVAPFLGVITSHEYNGFNERYLFPWSVCEYYKNKGLDEFLYNQNSTHSRRFHLLKGVIRGLAHVHGMSIVHGDLKASNVLVDDLDVAKICDFGSSHIECTCYNGPTDHDGTLPWDSPELYEDNPRTASSDIWALGCLALEAHFMQVPYDADPRIACWKIMNDLPPASRESVDFEGPISDVVWDMMQKCWNFDPDGRPSAQMILDNFEALGTNDNLQPTISEL